MVWVFYNISLLIAKSAKSHSIGEKFISPAVKEVLKNVLQKPASDIVKKISLSNNTSQLHVDERRDDIQSFLCHYLQSNHFRIQLDESTSTGNEAFLLVQFRFIMDQEIR